MTNIAREEPDTEDRVFSLQNEDIRVGVGGICYAGTRCYFYIQQPIGKNTYFVCDFHTHSSHCVHTVLGD